MQIGFVGLGRMGANMVRRLRRGNADVVAYNRHAKVAQDLAGETGAHAAASLQELVAQLPAPRIVWLMLPAGEATDQAIDTLVPLLSRGDLLVDGANANYHEAERRAARLKADHGIDFVDVGVSGGIWGLQNGYAMMIGGDAQAVQRLEPFIKILAPGPDQGWVYCGPAGAGHFVKMVHNGIEYGMMQAFAEGFALMRGKEDFNLPLAKIAESWRYGSVVRSWLLDLTADFLKQDEELANIEPYVADSGEGRWTAIEAVEQGVPAPVMSLALMMRFASQGKAEYGDKLLAMMRKGFGGHAVKQEGES